MHADTKLRESLIGTEIGGCRLELPLSGGGMGLVFRAHHLILDKPVAVKLLPPNLAKAAEYRDRFAREARIAGAIEHSNVVAVYGTGQSGEYSYIIMRYLDGAPLSRLATRQGLDQMMAARLGEQLCNALMAVHRAGYVHRDIKPENILLTHRGEAFLTDFGVATETGEARPPGRGGSPPYMSPEQCRGEPLDGRSDLYSLGATLWQLLAGRRPFLGTTAASLMLQHQQDVPPPLQMLRQDANPGLVMLVESMLAKAPERRPANAHELAAAFAEVQEELRALRRASSMLIQQRKPGGSSASDSTFRRAIEEGGEEEREIEARVEQVELGLLSMNGEESLAGHAPHHGQGQQAGEHAARKGSDAFGKQQFEKAVDYLDRALEFRPADSRLLVTRGLARQRLGDADLAEQDFLAAIESDPRNVRAHSALGALLRLTGRMGEAEQTLQRAIEIDPSSVEARITLGRMYEHMGSFGLARRQYEAAIEANLHDERPFVALSALLIGQGKLGVAKGFLGSARERNPTSAPALYWLGAIAAREGRLDFALRQLEDAVKAGLRDWRLLEDSPEYIKLQQAPRYKALVRLMKQGGSDHIFADSETFSPEARDPVSLDS